jgi:hypothetical protein
MDRWTEDGGEESPEGSLCSSVEAARLGGQLSLPNPREGDMDRPLLEVKDWIVFQESHLLRALLWQPRQEADPRKKISRGSNQKVALL